MWPPLRHSGALLGALAGLPTWAVAMACSPRWREQPGQRLGAAPRSARGSIWVHAASVGEILAATRLVDALHDRGWPVLASTMTVTGQQVLARARPEVPRVLAPFDHPWCVDRALARARPRALVLIETELWPCWIAAAERARVPVCLVSARLSDRSFARYRRLRRLLAPTLGRIAALGARSEEDAERFRALGLPPDRLVVTGDLKLEPPGREPSLAPDLGAALEGVAPLVAASTHEGEEEIVLDAWERVRQRVPPAATLVLAPRHPERAARVAGLAAGRGHRVRRRTGMATDRLAPDEVLVLDTVGELAALLPRAASVFVGGSLVPVGGHNVVEPAWAGRPVLFGPHTANWRAASRALLDGGGGRLVAGAEEIASAWSEWLRDPQTACRTGSAARQEVLRHQGATERAVALVSGVLERGQRGSS